MLVWCLLLNESSHASAMLLWEAQAHNCHKVARPSRLSSTRTSSCIQQQMLAIPGAPRHHADLACHMQGVWWMTSWATWSRTAWGAPTAAS